MAYYTSNTSGGFETAASGVYTSVEQTPPPLQVVDGFESGNLSDWGDNSSGGGDPSDFGVTGSTGGQVYDGTYALACPGGTTAHMTSASGLPNYPAPGDTYNIRFYLPDASSGFAYFRFGWQDNSNFYYMMPRPGDGTWRLRKATSASGHTTLEQTSYSWNSGMWYRAELDWGTDGSMVATLFDANTGEYETSVSTTDSDYGQGGVGILTNGFGSTWYVDHLTLNDGE